MANEHMVAFGLAARRHEAVRLEDRSQLEICALISSVAPSGWDDFTTDGYDNSIEVYRVGGDGAAIVRVLHDAGFYRVWIHPHPSATEDGGGIDCKCPCNYRPGTGGGA